MYKLIVGDSNKEIKNLPSNSVDSIVTDPPYGLRFMNNKWDYDVPNTDFWRECLRVLKPGGHLLSFGGSRTFHRMAVAIEDAGFDIRDTIMWLYGSGFPKSHNVSKAIDKSLGVEPQVIGEQTLTGTAAASGRTGRASTYATDVGDTTNQRKTIQLTKPSSPEAQKWEGWGTSLKPAHEPIILARKPFKGTVVKNVLKHGTGAINIDESRIESEDSYVINRFTNGAKPWGNAVGEAYESVQEDKGRWPANVILDEEASAFLDTQEPKASRFFYSPKVSKKERGAGNNHPTVKPMALMRYLVRLVTPDGGTVFDPFTGSGTTGVVAVEDGYYFIGMEREPEYAEISKNRLQSAARSDN